MAADGRVHILDVALLVIVEARGAVEHEAVDGHLLQGEAEALAALDAGDVLELGAADGVAVLRGEGAENAVASAARSVAGRRVAGEAAAGHAPRPRKSRVGWKPRPLIFALLGG